MQAVTLEHNLYDFELEETLEKSLKVVRAKVQKPERQLREPAYAALAKGPEDVFGIQIKKMIDRIKDVINEGVA